MPKFPSTPYPRTSPWGPVQQATQIAPGMWSVMTSSHGGLLLSDERQASMPDALRIEVPYYEEDCDWALVYLAFENELRARPDCSDGLLQLAVDTVKCWHPDRFTAHTGEKVAPNESHILRTRDAYQAAIGEYCTTTAWGDWADWVPEGKTGVLARKLESVNHLGRPTYGEEEICALIDKEVYAARGEVTNLRDTPHEVIDMPESLRPKRVA